jgi:HD superfamily phosphodiesterase
MKEEMGFMERMTALRAEVDALLDAQQDTAERHAGFLHLNAVSQAAALLAARRALDGTLCAAAGLLHDIYSFRTLQEADHAQRGAWEAAAFLQRAGFSAEQSGVVCHAISRHSDKAAMDGPYDECLKDADVLAHWLADPGKAFEPPKVARIRSVMAELGLTGTVNSK